MKKKPIPGWIIKIFLALLSPFLLNVFWSVIIGEGFSIEYRKILLTYFSVSSILLLGLFLFWLTKLKFSNNEYVSTEILFTFLFLIVIILFSTILYIWPFRVYLYDPEKYFEEKIENQSNENSTIDELVETNTVIPTVEITTPTPHENNLLNDDCISTTQWTAYRAESFTKTNNCWNIPGLIPLENKLEFVINEYARYGTYGIYTPIDEKAEIKIYLTIEQMEIPFGGNYARIFFGIVPSPKPEPNYGMMFFLQVESNNQAKPLLKYRIPNAINTTSLNEDITIGITHEINLSLKGQYANLYIDGHQAGDKFNLPDNPSFFWLGFQAEDGTIIDATISKITIE